MSTALIIGATGQDGSYLAELLLLKGYQVHGTKRRSSSLNTERVDHLMTNPNFKLHYADVLDVESLISVMALTEPAEIYNLAAQSDVALSFSMPIYSVQATGVGTLNVLEAFRIHARRARFYQASSSEMFGNSACPQSEATEFSPCSPYGAAKVLAHQLAMTYRDAYGLYISCGILFNHESPRRGETFVTRKITRALGRIRAGLQKELILGNPNARRDWGYAPEYVDAMWRMLQRDEPANFVIGTGVDASVFQFLDVALDAAGLTREVVKLDGRYARPFELSRLCASPRHAATNLHWKAKTHFRELARLMVAADIDLALKEARCAI